MTFFVRLESLFKKIRSKEALLAKRAYKYSGRQHGKGNNKVHV